MKIILQLLSLFISISSFSQNIDSLWFKRNYTKKEQYITMRDGVRLFTSIYTPNDSIEKHPILMTRTPYNCSPYGVDKYRKFYENYLKEYLKEKYNAERLLFWKLQLLWK